jgi:hypothetical protein
MVEFTEANLQRTGRSTAELYRTIEESGYLLYRFDPGSGQLVNRPLDGPIWYENLFAVRDVGPVNARLREADPGRRRAAWDLVQRGIAGATARDAEDVARRAAARAAGEAKELAAAREAALTVRWTAQVDTTRRELEAAQEAGRHLARQLSEVRAALEESRQAAERARDEAAAAQGRAQELKRQLKETRAEAAKNRQRLRSFCVSKYERVSWALGIRPKPAWVDEVVAGQNGAASNGGGAGR